MKACTGEPVSYLRLERYHLGELRAFEQHAVEHHLAQCDACRQCLTEIEVPLALPELPALAPSSPSDRVRQRPVRKRPSRTRWLPAPRSGWLALATAACALAALFVLRATPGLDPPVESVGIKGGELAIGLVREHAGSAGADPRVFAAGDRFKVLLTCPLRPASRGALQLQVDVVVFQGDQASFPLAAQRVTHCGNQLALPGAFSLSGDDEAQVCIAASETGAIDRAALRAGGLGALPALSACERVRSSRW